ncbi:alanine-glyoxylate aminotransferase 2, isoform CRA_b [Rattus norvegicus]|uniref:Alanine--glyoxylate aminotransferase 2, mitochondrial n=1 Tax=Rattus norvegicus TaxID=10116 RepID=A6KJT5_RAT|nr:alanine-glyoxylate aminotransferase 2, isoform CRA_b [Rattus norvegicus]
MSLAWRTLQKAFYLETSLRILQMRPSLSCASRIYVPKLTLHTKHNMPPCDFSPEKYQSLAYNHVLEIHKHTFGGSPLACAIGSAVLEVIEEENLQRNSQEVGTYMLLKFAKLRDEFDIVGDVRGKGLMVGIEMVQDKISRQPLPKTEVNQIHEDCKDMGLLVGRGGNFSQTFRIAPPMRVTKLEVDFAFEVFRSALTQHMERRAK